jgi:taurine dioxygenase
LTQTVLNQPASGVHGNIISPQIGSKRPLFDLKPEVPGFVATLSAPPLVGMLDQELIASILQAWKEYPVLVFPNQALDPVRLANFSEQIGQFGHDPYVQATAQHDHVIEVRREAAETTPIFGQSWHSDWSFQHTPPSGTLLQSSIIPPHGGDTVFASTYKSFESLSPAMQALLMPLDGMHSASTAYGPNGLFAKDNDTRSMKIVVSETANESCLHPIVRTHPESGKKCLYINHVYTMGIEGFKEAESSALLNYLFRHMSQHAFTYRHRWRQDTLVMWDNRCVIHFADGGYEGHQRVLYRTTLAGEKPSR